MKRKKHTCTNCGKEYEWGIEELNCHLYDPNLICPLCNYDGDWAYD
jgi:hypothetical protein